MSVMDQVKHDAAINRLNSPFVGANTTQVMDILWHLSEWSKAQTNSQGLEGDRYVNVRAGLDHVARQLQALQSDIGTLSVEAEVAPSRTRPRM